MNKGLYQSGVANYVCNRGKVRDCYDFGETMLIIVTTDRISAFDHVFPNTTIPDKGVILTKLSNYWASTLDIKYHLISAELNHLPKDFRKPEFEGRTVLVEKANVIPFECVVRGYLTGSAWKEYQKTGQVCGIKFPSGLKENQQFPKPILTPAIKKKNGHDENVTFEHMAAVVGMEYSAEIEALSIEAYTEIAQLAWSKGIIVADTKFEWGILPQNSLVLVDEIVTPDSSRFWPISEYVVGSPIKCSFDKQYLRDYINGTDWDKQSVPPPLPQDVIDNLRNKYIEVYEKLTGSKFK